MKLIKLLKKVLKRRTFEAKRGLKRGFKFVVFKNKYSRDLRKYARMEAHRALKHGFRYIQTQIAIRPRIRLFSKLTLALIISLFLTSQGASYFKAKEPEIKVNGQAILVAKTNEDNSSDETVLQASISSKRSPFNFRMPVENSVISQGFSSYHRAD